MITLQRKKKKKKMKINLTHCKSTVYAIALAVTFLVGCDKNEDIDENSVRQSYSFKFSDVVPYDSTRYHAADSLMHFIIDNMALDEPDTLYNTWIITGKSIEDCDSIIKKSFKNACSLVDPDEYGGMYAINVYRINSTGQDEKIAEEEFVAETGNAIDLSKLLEAMFRAAVGDNIFIYDVAISQCGDRDPTGNALTKNGYNALWQDLNHNAGGPNVFVGYKAAAADFETDIVGTVQNQFTGETETRKLKAKEAAITKIVCLQTGHDYRHPQTMKGAPGTPLQSYDFTAFNVVGNSNGDTNQGTTKGSSVYSWLYYSRSNNQNQQNCLSDMYVNTEKCRWPWTPVSTYGGYIQLVDFSNNYAYPINEVADLNRGTGKDYVYLGVSYKQ